MIHFPDMPRVDFRGMRFYKTPEGQHYASITTMLGISAPEEKKQSLANWQNSLGATKAASITKAAADRGTNVHLLIERHLKGEDLQLNQFSVEDVNSFTALKLKLKSITEVVGQEVALYSDALQIAGTCDCIGIYKGKLSIIDFKTSTRLKTKKEIYDYKLQCAFYGIAFTERFDIPINDGVVLMTAATGFPMEFNFTFDEYWLPLAERVDIFYEQLNSQI